MSTTNPHVVRQMAWTVTLVLSGVAAGMFVMDCFGYYPLLATLPDDAAIQLHQESVPLHRGLLRLAIQSSGVACLVAIVFGDKASRWLLVASVVCLLALVVYTNYALVPLNREIATWTPDSPPEGWRTVFSQMIVRERLRTVLPSLAFVLVSLAAQRQTDRP